MPSPTRRRAAVLLAALCVLLPAVGCSDPDDDATGGPTTEAPDPAGPAEEAGTAADATGDAQPPEQYSGPDDDFYVVPDPLPPGEPGQLIRVMDLGESDGTRTLRIMYHSRDAQDRDRAVTGILTHPTGEAPDGGWPVVSWAHGTTGLAAPCAPSRADQPSAPGLGIEGVHVATDYIGLGPVHADGTGEIHPYLSRPSEGHSVIDAVRAARLLPDAHASERWLAAGHSQGGHGALSAHELGATYAPELELLGTVSMAPAAVFEKTYPGVDQVVAPIVGIMGLYGAATEHPELDPDDYVTPATGEAATVIEESCLDDIITAFVRVGVEAFYDVDPFTTEPAASIILANDVGHTAVEAPLFLISGTADDRVVIERVRDLYDRLCAAGQVTELLIVDGANHGDVIPRTAEQTTAWLQDRLDGAPATDSCSED